MAFSTSFTNLRETAGDSAIVRIEKQEKFERSQIVSRVSDVMAMSNCNGLASQSFLKGPSKRPGLLKKSGRQRRRYLPPHAVCDPARLPKEATARSIVFKPEE